MESVSAVAHHTVAVAQLQHKCRLKSARCLRGNRVIHRADAVCDIRRYVPPFVALFVSDLAFILEAQILHFLGQILVGPGQGIVGSRIAGSAQIFSEICAVDAHIL